jgi:vacuolar-type H+-ATPase subunit E/Vma4
MGLHEVEQAILAQARAAAEVENAQAKAAADELIANARAQIARERARFDDETKRLLERMERRETARATARSKTVLLGARSDALNEVFAGAAQRLDSLPARERADLFAKTVARAQRELPSIARIECNPLDAATAKKLAPHVEIVETPRIRSGLVAHDTTGMIRSALIHDTLLAHIRERELPSIARTLFASDSPKVKQ